MSVPAALGGVICLHLGHTSSAASISTYISVGETQVMFPPFSGKRKAMLQSAVAVLLEAVEVAPFLATISSLEALGHPGLVERTCMALL